MTSNSLYYNCNLFKEKIEDYSNFSFIQQEIALESPNNDSKFKLEKIEYKCSFEQSSKFDNKNPLLIIPIKDNPKLLNYTLDNLKKHKVDKYSNILVVDDRSKTDIKQICKNYDVSYIKVDNEKGFNFSMLNNIGAKIGKDKGCREIILWNSDLWTTEEATLPEIIKLHRENGSTISGTKLVYPPFKWDNEERTDIKEIFKINKSHRGTVQYGGSLNHGISFYHAWRFADPSYYLVNTDKLEFFITGAFQIVDLDWFISVGGLNPSLAKNYQDNDLCMKANKQDRKIYYFGKDKFLYHDESVSLNKEGKFDLQLRSDQVLYFKIWNEKEFMESIHKIGKFNGKI